MNYVIPEIEITTIINQTSPGDALDFYSEPHPSSDDYPILNVLHQTVGAFVKSYFKFHNRPSNTLNIIDSESVESKETPFASNLLIHYLKPYFTPSRESQIFHLNIDGDEIYIYKFTINNKPSLYITTYEGGLYSYTLNEIIF